MYFETGQGSALSANAHHGVDQQTCEARSYGVARHFKPLLVNTVVGFIGPEYLYDGKQIIRAGLEDHFCGKLLGLPMGCDVCYTNHAEADQDDMDSLMTLLGVAGCNYLMGVPGADDIMLHYQSTSFHDALYLRQVLGLKPAPEFETWLEAMGVMHERTAAAGRRGAPAVGRTSAGGEGMSTKEIQGSKVTVMDDPWAKLRLVTGARIALGRAGGSLPTARLLEFQLAHARARDAVHLAFDAEGMTGLLLERGHCVLRVHSEAESRADYLKRPDLGRRLDAPSQAVLQGFATGGDGGFDAALVIADGLSPLAIHRHAAAVLDLAWQGLTEAGWRLAPVIVAGQSRVALCDEIGELLGAKQVAILIGERPGLSAADSLGIYLTYGPRVGRTDAERNCISNIRPEGLGYREAAQTLVRLMLRARRLRLTGVGLKDEGDKLTW